MTKYNLGIIGGGMYGKVLMRCLQRDERANITWINSANEATTKSAAQEFGVEKGTLDYRDILADPMLMQSSSPHHPTCMQTSSQRRSKPPSMFYSRSQ
jgi:hypothetical protein